MYSLLLLFSWNQSLREEKDQEESSNENDEARVKFIEELLVEEAMEEDLQGLDLLEEDLVETVVEESLGESLKTKFYLGYKVANMVITKTY